MDIHIVDTDAFSVEDVVKAHMKDLAIQDRFGVTQLKYWVNEEAKTLFCLMEGPSQEACNNVHKNAHGNTACNIVEVSEDEFDLYMGVGKSVKDLAYTDAGEIDTGYRTILLANIIRLVGEDESYIQKLSEIIEKHQGVHIPDTGSKIMVSFIYAANAITCALAINEFLKSMRGKVEYIVALASGRPIDEKGVLLFEETKMKVECLCSLGFTNKIYIATETNALLTNGEDYGTEYADDITVFKTGEQWFLQKLFEILYKGICNSDFKSNDLPDLLGMSKSQAYRKISSLTGMAPNQLIRELRLRKSLELIKRKDKTISQISYKVGFNSPTYFARAFKKRFYLSPSFVANR